MLKLYPFLLTICFILIRNSLFAFDVENHSSQDSIEIGKFVDYLVKQKILEPKEHHKLVINNFQNGNYHIQFTLSEWYPPQAYNFSNNIEFVFYDQNTKLLDGFVIANHILMNAQNYFFYKNGYPNRNAYAEDIQGKHINTILKKNFADTLIFDTLTNYVKTRGGKIIGNFKLEFKTLAFHGCLFDSEYSLIEPNSYLEFKSDIIDFEAVLALYTDSPQEFNSNKFYGTTFYMFNLRDVLIHKGIISEAGIGISSE